MNKLALWGTVGILSMSAAGMGGMANAQVVGGLYQQYGQNAVYRYYNGALHQIPSTPAPRCRRRSAKSFREAMTSPLWASGSMIRPLVFDRRRHSRPPQPVDRDPGPTPM